MAITSDGTHRFGIPNSPLTINSVTYIAEDVTFDQPTETVDIEDDEGTPIGQTIIDKKKSLSCTLQLSNASTVLPTRGAEFAFEGSNYYVQTVTRNETQAQYAKVSLTATEVIN